MTTKICAKCKCEIELTEFRNVKNSKDGKHSYCKICERLSNKQSRLKNKEKIKIRKQQEYQNNKEKILEQRKEYYSKNKEIVLERVSKYTEINREQINIKRKEFRKENLEHVKNQDRKKYIKFREQILEDRKRYFKENKEVINKKHRLWEKTENGRLFLRNRNMKRRTKLKNGDVTTQQLKELLKNTTECYWCNNKLIKGNIHIDHYTPLASGGLHTISNLVVSCRQCNLSKGSQDPLEFANSIGKLF